MPVKRKARGASRTYGSYLAKIHRQVNGKLTISAAAVDAINSLVEDLEDRVSGRAIQLARLAKKKTLKASHVQTATRLIFPREVGAHAVAEGVKAIVKFGDGS